MKSIRAAACGLAALGAPWLAACESTPEPREPSHGTFELVETEDERGDVDLAVTSAGDFRLARGERASLGPDGRLAIERAPVDAQGRFESVRDYLVARYDADGDGRVARAEYDRGDEVFARLDADGDGALTDADFEGERGGPGALRGERPKGPAAGAAAPDFTLDVLSGGAEGERVTLSDFRGDRPVALIFGSYT